jgi:hypothetical protein
MARQINCSRSSVQRSLDRVVEAGWVEKKRPPHSNEEGQPSNSYMYRVILDRDDFVIPSGLADENDDDESYAENASEAADCPPVGSEGAQLEGHPGAQPGRAPGAQPYMGTKNVPLERPLLERERDARARDRKARFIASFEQRWPTAAADDRQRTGYAAEALTEEEEHAALAGIGPFLDYLKRLNRKNVPAGWRYLEEKRWTLLEQKSDGKPVASSYPPNSAEAKAILMLHDIVGRREAFFKIWRRPDGSVSYPKPITARLAALSQAPEPSAWPTLNHGQAGAWENLLRSVFDDGLARQRLREGSRAPWPWPPSVEGKLYTDAAGVPPLSNEDLDALSSEGQR